MDYIQVADHVARQVMDASTIFTELSRVATQARSYAGGMYWKREGAYEYLVKTQLDNRQRRLGARSHETERTYTEFTSRKEALRARLAELRIALAVAERTNKAVKAGRTPAIVIALLNALDAAGLGPHFTVVGTHALYAYETAAGVRITPGALATQDVDLLWDARRRVQFMADLEKLDASILQILQRADTSFQRKEGQNETAINAKGFEVDFLRRQPVDGDPHPFRFSDDVDDLWPVQAEKAAVLTSAARFEHLVISATGTMALMRTIAPRTFVDFKRWMAAEARNRPAPKRRRDERQAAIVQSLLDQGWLTG